MDVEVLDVTPESSPAPEPSEPVSSSVETLSDTERDEWLKTGTLPKSAGTRAASVTEESRPGATKDEPVSSSANGKSAQESEKATAATRVKELLAERNAQRQEIEQLRARVNGNGAQTQNPPPEPAKPAAEAPKLERPKESDYQSWEEYQDALVDYRVEKRLATEKAANAAKAEHFYRESQQQRENRKLDEIEQQAAKEIDGYDSHADAALQIIHSSRNRAPFAFLANIGLDGARVLAHLGANQEVLKDLIKQDPADVLTELAHLRRSLKPNGNSAPVKVTTSAPPPPTNLGGNKTAPVDEKAAALAAGDFLKYKALADAEEIKARKAGRY